MAARSSASRVNPSLETMNSPAGSLNVAWAGAVLPVGLSPSDKVERQDISEGRQRPPSQVSIIMTVSRIPPSHMRGRDSKSTVCARARLTLSVGLPRVRLCTGRLKGHGQLALRRHHPRGPAHQTSTRLLIRWDPECAGVRLVSADAADVRKGHRSRKAQPRQLIRIHPS